MAQSVFAGGQTFKGAFRADKLKLTFGGIANTGYLIQNVQFSYTQQVSMLYELGTENVYYVGGRAQGSATLARVIGPAPSSAAFISTYNDLCNPQDIGFSAQAGCGQSSSGGGMNYNLQSSVLVGISGNVTSQDVVVNEQLQFIFVDLEY